MWRVLWFSSIVAAVVFGCGASPVKRAVPSSFPGRPPVDRQAMEEAIRASEASGENYASSASYAHFLWAQLLQSEGDHGRALDELRLALVTDEGNPYLLVALAEEYTRLGDLDRAERTLRKVVETAPNDASAQLWMGRVLTEKKKLARARIHLRRAIKLAPHEAEAYLALAQLELEAGRPDAAMAAVDDLSRAIPGESRGLRLLGMVFADRNDLPRAEQMLRRAVEVYPGDDEAWARLAQIYEADDRDAEAEQAYAEALARNPDDLELLLSAGRVALRIGAVARARAWFDRVLSLTDEPETAVQIAFAYLSADRMVEAAETLEHARTRGGTAEPRLAFYAALMHERLRNWDRAAEAYAAVPRTSELYAEARVRRASALSLAGHHRAALEAFRKVIAEKPDFLPAYPAWARALERSGALTEAERMLRAAIARKPSSTLYEALSQNLQRQGRDQDAVKLLEDALARRPKDLALRYLLGAVYERSGRIDASIALMRAVLEEHPDDPAALNFVGYTLADHGRDFDEAERLVKRALELRPDSGAFLDSLGWVYFRRGQAQKAVEVLERAVALEPEEPVIIDHLGDAYARVDRRPDAVRAYQRALEVLAAADDPLDGPALRRSLEHKLKMLSTEAAGR
ncbi:MAG: tetratricopeptide repeat protein [Myxococcaceae bacterium]|nr:tetratricopeptide repeat protein [Myxococcaceae bacterium]